MSRKIRIFFAGLSLCGGAPLPSRGGETGGVRATFVGHATVLLQGSQATFLTDPFFKPKMLWLKRRIPPAMAPGQLPPLDAVLVSHTHPDHFDSDALRALRPRPVVVMPWGRGKTLRSDGLEVVSLRPGESWTCKNAKVTAVRARHNAWHNVGYVIEMDGKRIYFTGDTKWFDELKDLSGTIDLMLMPFGGTPVIGNIWTMPQAAEAVSIVKPKIVVPIHMETFTNMLTGRPSAPPEPFRDLLAARVPGTRCRVLRPGDTITLCLPGTLGSACARRSGNCYKSEGETPLTTQRHRQVACQMTAELSAGFEKGKANGKETH